MKILKLIAPYIDGEKCLKKLNDLPESDWSALLAEKPAVCSALGRIVAKLKLKALEKDEKKALDKLAEKVEKAAALHPAKLMSKDYAAEQARIVVDGKKIHVNPQTTLSGGKKIKDLFKKWEKKSKKQDFDDYLQHSLSGDDKNKLKKNAVKYLTDKEREPYKVNFKKGTIRSDKIGKKASGKFIYVLSPDMKDLFLMEKKSHIKHSSFFKGAPIVCAGKVELKDGKPVHFTNETGHYKATQEMMDNLATYLSDENRLGNTAKDLIKIVR
jgi:hypothetical protein